MKQRKLEEMEEEYRQLDLVHLNTLHTQVNLGPGRGQRSTWGKKNGLIEKGTAGTRAP